MDKTVKRIGQILIEMGYVKPSRLDFAIKKQRKGDRRRLGEILVGLRYVTQAQLEEAIEIQNKNPVIS